MHHAAMANKKDMMFTLARLGCDWRAKADGIEGATAAYVLCGQHHKTTRQQASNHGGCCSLLCVLLTSVLGSATLLLSAIDSICVNACT